MAKKKSGFTQEKYYKENKVGISWAKKQRYKDDPEYREKIIQRAKEAHLRKKGSADGERVDSTTFTVLGVLYYTVSHIAKACNVSSSLINYYHEQGYLPKPRQMGEYTWRLYRFDYAEAAIPIIIDYLDRKFSDPTEILKKFKSATKDIFEDITE